MKRIISAIAAVIMLAAFAVPCGAADISAKSAIVIDADTLSVLYEEKADVKMKMASTTKIMTALVVLDNCDLDDVVTVPASAAGVEGSSLYLKAGDKCDVETLLYGMMLESGNDAAAALAVYTAGSVEKFAAMMNTRAAELGCRNTHFVNPHGLDNDGHYSTARDLALITAEAMKNGDFRRIVATEHITVDGRTFKNHNKLLAMYDGCIGVKTGYTKSSGRSLVSCAERDGVRLICVTLCDPDDWDDHAALFDECFSKWKKLSVRCGDYSVTMPVISGVKKEVTACPVREAELTVPAGADVKIVTEGYKFVYAPVTAGETLGRVTVMVDGKTVFETDLAAAKTVAADEKQKLSPSEKLLRILGRAVDNAAAKLGYEPER